MKLVYVGSDVPSRGGGTLELPLEFDGAELVRTVQEACWRAQGAWFRIDGLQGRSQVQHARRWLRAFGLEATERGGALYARLTPAGEMPF